MLGVLLTSYIAYEGFFGDPLGGGVRYYFTYDSLSLLFRGGAGIGGFLSYLNLPVMGDLLLNVPVQKGASVYMGGGVLSGVKFLGKLDAGIGVRVVLGGEFKVARPLSVGFEFAPLVVKSFGGKAHPGISFGLRVIYYPNPPEEVEEPEVPQEETERTTVRRRISSTSVSTKPARRDTTKREEVSPPKRKVDREAAEREYKLGLQAYANGDLEGAKRHFEAALRYDPTYEKAKMALEKVKRQLGER